jgi:hypothetical protein
MQVSRRGFVGTAAGTATAAFLDPSFATSAARPVRPRYTAIHPGEEWLDNRGKPIQAHGGSVISVGDHFYWYGENKEFTTGKGAPQSWGIRFYRSKDLYNWEDLGSIIPPSTEQSSPLSSKTFPERPHILYNPRTRKYVCWIKVRGQGPEYRLVMAADRITGPYRTVHRHLAPAGMAAGDFDLVADPDTGRAYMYFEHDHKELVCIELTDDWCGVTDRMSRHFPSGAPDTKEGIACFRRNGKLYLTASGMTGYFPNPTTVVAAHDYHGPFEEVGDLHPSDRSRTSFNSQISCIFKHPRRKDLYIAMADRWFPHLGELGGEEFASGRISENVRSAIRKFTAKPRQSPTAAEIKALQFFTTSGGSALSDINTSVSRYVWLPIRFSGDRPTIEWRDNWRIDEFA